MDWARILAYITGTVNQELLLRNEYLAAEIRILKVQLKTPLRLTDGERVDRRHRYGPLGLTAMEGTKEADLITAVLMYAMRCLAEGDQAALRHMNFGIKEIEVLREMLVADH